MPSRIRATCRVIRSSFVIVSRTLGLLIRPPSPARMATMAATMATRIIHAESNTCDMPCNPVQFCHCISHLGFTYPATFASPDGNDGGDYGDCGDVANRGGSGRLSEFW